MIGRVSGSIQVPRQFGNQPKTKACKSYNLQAFLFFVIQFDLNNFNKNSNRTVNFYFYRFFNFLLFTHAYIFKYAFGGIESEAILLSNVLNIDQNMRIVGELPVWVSMS